MQWYQNVYGFSYKSLFHFMPRIWWDSRMKDIEVSPFWFLTSRAFLCCHHHLTCFMPISLQSSLLCGHLHEFLQTIKTHTNIWNTSESRHEQFSALFVSYMSSHGTHILPTQLKVYLVNESYMLVKSSDLHHVKAEHLKQHMCNKSKQMSAV